MSLRYLPEHAENALLALELARKEAAHLQYTHRTLFALPIDAAWVQQLASRDELAEKVEAFVSRFGRLQDHLGEKLIPRFAALLGEAPKSLLDVLAYAEKMQWLAVPRTSSVPENCETCWSASTWLTPSYFCKPYWQPARRRKCFFTQSPPSKLKQ